MKWRLSYLGIVLAVLPSMAQEPVTIDLNHAEGLLFTAPDGYDQASFSFGAVPEGQGTDGVGLTILLQSGDGLLLYGPSVETGEGLVLIECSVWTNSPNVFLALVGLNSPVDGSLIANMPANGEDYQGSWHRMEVLYDPKDDAVMPAFQVVATGDGTTTVYLDQIVVTPLRMSGEQLKEIIPAPSTITIDLPGLAEGAKPLEMVLIQPGTFTMGCPSTERGYYGNEWLSHEVTITNAFYMGKYEVTQAQWEAVMGNNPSYFSGYPNHPVETVSWNNCQTFIEGLNDLGQGTFRLPTEAEWEYACRAGTTTRFSFGDALECADTGDNYCEIMDQYMWWLGNNTYQGNVYGTKEVGLKLPNPWGLYDMHGNVWEWCADWWQEPTLRGAQIDPQGPTSGSYRVSRGGFWFFDAQFCRSADRSGDTPDRTSHYLGFRVIFPLVDNEKPTPTPAPTVTADIPGLAEGAKTLDMALIPAGTFIMGSPVDEQDRYPDEGPQHEVTISKPFYMGKYEVTNAQFRAFRPSHDSQDYSGITLNGDDQPVVNLIWNDAIEFCQWLEEQNPGMEFRLPTEAEWEYACRAGTAERFYWGDDPDYSEAGNYSWYAGNSGGPTHTIGLKLPNPWDLYDMSGNVWEWCSDWFGSYSSDAQIDPMGPSSGSSHVLRGGSGFDIQKHLRSAYRSGPPPGGPHVLVGFRVVCPGVE